MNLVILIQCSKSKLFDSHPELIWDKETTIELWNNEWDKCKSNFNLEELYTGRSFKEQIRISKNNKDSKIFVISAGGGLIPIGNTKIPSYESTFKKNHGPTTKDWHKLPFGGLQKLTNNSIDQIISFASPQYHKALLNDPEINNLADKLVVTSTSPLAKIAGKVIEIHPRSIEVLKVASIDLNTEILRIYLSEGIEGLNKIKILCEKLPTKVKRNPITDDELIDKIRELAEIKSLNKLVRYLRDELLIKASMERISIARKKVLKSKEN